MFLIVPIITHLSKKITESESLFEREFFGHCKGAFTEADRDQPGYFDQAHGGTLFLDEISELKPDLQAKLLRALEDKAYIPVGTTLSRHADVRIIGATNKDLKAQLQQGLIREDFFYRIDVITITLPPLRDRREDIPLLVDHFLKDYSEGNVCCAMMPGHIIEALCTYDWPGNVRELQNELQRYLAGQPLEFIGDAPAQQLEKASVHGEEFDLTGLSFNEAVEAFEKNLLAHALAHNAGHQAKTCAMLRIPPKTLYRKMHKYGLKSKKDGS